ncbi:MAG TPA: radical SAM protein [Alloacidobacterium sp.]|nr:radical SAM protein [Alloacidobacterium sp.]
MSADLACGPTLSIAQPDRLRSLPILLLNVHENCNCRCLMCDIWKRPAGAELSLDMLATLRDSLHNLGVRQIVLTGGEPLLHTQFEELCRFLKEQNLRITLLTTGLLLQKRAESVAAWIDEIIISLDGPEAIHDRIRGIKRGFDLIRAGIFAVRKHRAAMPVHARSVVQRLNFQFLRETVTAAKQLQFDSISFLAADITSHAFNRELVWPVERQTQVALTSADVAILEDEIELLIEQYCSDITEHYIVESPQKLRRIARRFREYLGELPPKAPLCNAPWVSAVIEVDGSVRPCFFHRSFGSIENTSLEKVINSPDAQRFRQMLDVGKDRICQKCVCSLNYKRSQEILPIMRE